MTEYVRVCWLEHPEPWTVEADLISRLDLPLNLDRARRNPFHPRLTELRARARQRARELPPPRDRPRRVDATSGCCTAAKYSTSADRWRPQAPRGVSRAITPTVDVRAVHSL
ncbi:GIY-YIG nuclease family protein [Streptomyces sulphureus]|uniref:GIY-YIG nuclease family protein n=1 Tax=Streptomyces sulphureus TaxID=47758 RepID=UPI00316ADFEF